jgi:hypothetical protein
MMGYCPDRVAEQRRVSTQKRKEENDLEPTQTKLSWEHH